jgi:hypothetical protein
MTIVAHQLQALEFVPRRPALSLDLLPHWSARMRVRLGHTRLMRVGEHLVLLDGEDGVVEVGTQQPQDDRLQPWVRHDVPVAAVGAGYESEPVIADPEGAVFRWLPGSEPQAVWEAGAPGASLSLVGLPHERLFFGRVLGGRRTMGVVDTRSGRTLWQRDGASALALPFESMLLLELTEELDVLVCLDAATGRECWRGKRLAGGLGGIIGVVQGSLWLATRSGTICALDVAKGRARHEMKLRDSTNPQGVLDDRGLFHACNGLSYQVLDLSGSGSLASQTQFVRSPEGPGPALGRLVLVAADDRLVFADERGSIFVVHPESPASPERLATANSLVVGTGIAFGRLFVLESAGFLRAYGDG